MLDNLRIPELADTTAMFSGLDQRSMCLDVDHFDRFSYPVSYSYNSRGFRDREWPSDLSSAVWCVGDSFTTGLGSPFEHTWAQRLSQAIGQPVINISMDGASNNWISRRVRDIYSEVCPQNVIIMWSYLHRRESPLGSTDYSRRLHHVNSTWSQDYQNLLQCQQQVRSHCANSNVIELIIPNWQPAVTQQTWNNVRGPRWPEFVNDLHLSNRTIVAELIDVHNIDSTLLGQQIQLLQQFNIMQNVIEVQQQDRARDGHHFDIVTADWVVEEIADSLRP